MTIRTLTIVAVVVVPLVFWTSCRSSVAAAEESVAQAAEQGETQDKLEKHIQTLIRGKVQDQIESLPSLSGAIVVDASLVAGESSDTLEIRLEGRVSDPAQQATIEAIAKEAMRFDPFLSKIEKRIEVSAKHMATGQGSDVLASRFYTMALSHFWARKYAEADWAFARALAEMGQSDELRYWRVITAIALKQNERAERKLASLLKANPNGSRTASIAINLERLQGPLRRQLSEMEDRVLIKLKP